MSPGAVHKFVTGQYAAGHDWGFMLGYVLALPVEDVVEAIDHRISLTYGEQAKLSAEGMHALALERLATLIDAMRPRRGYGRDRQLHRPYAGGARRCKLDHDGEGNTRAPS
jgi:hypothetical protein